MKITTMKKSTLSIILILLLLTQNVSAVSSKTVYFNPYYQEENGKAVKFYPCVGGRIMREDGEFSFIITDHLGSTSIVTDENGSNPKEMSYYPYGSTLGSEGDIPTERKFTGQIEDDSTDLYYYVDRYYFYRQHKNEEVIHWEKF